MAAHRNVVIILEIRNNVGVEMFEYSPNATDQTLESGGRPQKDRQTDARHAAVESLSDGSGRERRMVRVART